MKTLNFRHLHSKEAPQDDIQTKCNELVLFCRIPRSKKEMMAFLKLSDRKSFDILAVAVQESPRHERRTGENLVLMCHSVERNDALLLYLVLSKQIILPTSAKCLCH